MRISDWSSDVCSSDLLALTDRVAFFQAGGEPALMSVQRAVAAIVLQNNGVAVAILAAFELDDAVGGCVDGRAGGCCIVDAFVPAPAAMHRVLAHAEGGADAREFQRSEERRVGKECVSTCKLRWAP